MIHFSPAKINLGLEILERRDDGFHMLRSVMYPIGLCDIIEIHQPAGDQVPVSFSQSGIRFEGDQEKNLCIQAWKLMASECTLPAVAIHLHKQIPVGAGLGGGSSNASTILKGLNLLAGSPVPHERLADLAARLGSDCPFFLHENAMMMEGRGELLSPSTIKLEGMWLVLLFPEIHISTPQAYAGVSPGQPELHLEVLLKSPIHQWKELVINDFEVGIFKIYPELAILKKQLYEAGALYASLSGSGSSLYGIFPGKPELPEDVFRYTIWEGKA